MSLATRCAWLNGCLLVVLALGLAIASARGGRDELTAVLVAAAVCTLCANAALVLATVWQGTPAGVSGALAGTLVGMLPPLAAGFALQRRGGALAEAGVFGWIVVFYVAALIVKTLLVAPNAATVSHPRGGSRPNKSTTSEAGA